MNSNRLHIAERAFAQLCEACEYDKALVHTVWALLSDHGDILQAKTGRRRVSGQTGVSGWAVSGALNVLLESKILINHGRAHVEPRYQFDVEALKAFWQFDPSGPVNESLWINSDLLGIQIVQGLSPWIVLLCQLDYDFAAYRVLHSILKRQNGLEWIRYTCREIADENALSRMTALRAVQTLEDMQLIYRDDSDKSRMRTDSQNLLQLLFEEFPRFDVLPGITPLAAVDRLFPISSGDAS